MTCRDDAPHSQGCPCWNAKVREDAYEEAARAAEGAYPASYRFDSQRARERAQDIADYVAEAIRALADKHRLEAGEAALRDT